MYFSKRFVLSWYLRNIGTVTKDATMTLKSGRRDKRFSALIIREPFTKPTTMVLPPSKQRDNRSHIATVHNTKLITAKAKTL